MAPDRVPFVRWLSLLSLVVVVLGPSGSGPAAAQDHAGSAVPRAVSFADVPTTHAFFPSISIIADWGVTSGCGGGNFCPDAFVTRGMMAVFVVKALHFPGYAPAVPAVQRFGDVPTSHPFAGYIDEMATLGIAAGCGAGNYCPDAVVTRGQMAVFIMRGAGVTNPPPPASQRFTDVPPSNPYYAYIEQMAARGVTSGCGAAIYCPDDPITRGQMAVFLVRGFGLTDHSSAGTPADVARFLEQATWGPTPALLARVQQIGIRAYLDEQFAATPTGYPAMPLMPNTVPDTCDAICERDNYSMYLLQRLVFTNALYGEDQLRQRVAWALHKIIVVSGRDMQPSWYVPYLQILYSNAFGDFRTILGNITLNPAMGQYLDMRTSTRNNPNENYAREILQLFSVGTDRLNTDGTPQRDGTGAIVPTYDQATVDGFTKVFTGWRLAAQPAPGVANYLDPMVLVANNHDVGSKLLLGGVTLPAGQPGATDLTMALDNIFNDPSVGPFLSRQLIRQLVTSNPSPPYIARVARVFNNNGRGVRGDLRAVVEAILLDPEARGADKGGTAHYGRLKEPVQFVNNVLRMFNPRSADGLTQSDGVLNGQTTPMGQDVLRPPTVFSYFPADWPVPGPEDLIGPEFGILSAATALRRANFVNTIVFSRINAGGNTPNGTSIDLAPLQALAGNPTALVDELNRSMLHGTLSAEMRTSIINAVTAVSATNTLKRARTAVYLVATSSQYQVQR
jgi:uncharacterized protein (DUF1800 family)